MKSFKSFFSILIIATSFTAIANDGLTPANETICDELQGSTPGLYGLCVAYCEAQDAPETLQLEVPLEEQEIKTSSRKILEKYDAKRRETDPKMPCVKYESQCPLWTSEELSQISIDNNSTWARDFYANRYYNGELVIEDIRDIASVNNYLLEARIYLRSGRYAGSYTDSSTNTYRAQELTSEEYGACRKQLFEHVTNPDDNSQPAI